MRPTRTRLSIALPVGDTPPREFRIFAAGENPTRKGTIVFDADAAAAVMAAYREHGVDVMIDLEHLSLDTESRAFDPDARGWAKLEVRNGELWAVDVRWTPEGDARLREKRQRYISPVVDVDVETGRAQSIFNVAITALPATDNAPALVAASQRKLNEGSMSLDEMAKIAEALGLGSDASVEDIVATIGAMAKKLQEAAAGGEEAPAPEEAAPAEEPMAEEPPAEEEQAAPQAVAAAAREIMSLSTRESLPEALEEIKVWRAAYLELSAERAKLAKDRARLEATERRALVAKLVTLGAETPATAFADPTQAPAKLQLCKRLANEPIAELRDRVAKLSAARPKTAAIKAPVSVVEGDEPVVQTIKGVGLTQRELDLCEEMGCAPEKYASLKAQQKAAAATAGGK